MDKAAFLGLLSRLGMDEGIVVLDDSLRDGYCVRKNGLRWEVSVRERGVETDAMGFPSEGDALRYLADTLVRIYRKA